MPRDEAPALTAHLLSTLPVADLTVEDPPIEAVIDQIYSGGCSYEPAAAAGRLIKRTWLSWMQYRSFFFLLAFGWMIPPLIYLFVWSTAAGEGTPRRDEPRGSSSPTTWS